MAVHVLSSCIYQHKQPTYLLYGRRNFPLPPLYHFISYHNIKPGNHQLFQENWHTTVKSMMCYTDQNNKGEFGYTEVCLNNFCPSLKCIDSNKSRNFIIRYKTTGSQMWYFAIYFKSLSNLTFKYLLSGIKSSLLMALLTMQILWKEQILTDTTFTKSSSDKVSNISMTEVRISFNVNPLTLPLLTEIHKKIEKLNLTSFI